MIYSEQIPIEKKVIKTGWFPGPLTWRLQWLQKRKDAYDSNQVQDSNTSNFFYTCYVTGPTEATLEAVILPDGHRK